MTPAVAFTPQELQAAERAVSSLLSKLEKTVEKLAPGTSQHTLAANRIAALRVSQTLIRAAMGRALDG